MILLKIGFVTDSACDIPKELYQKYNIKQVPIVVLLKDKKLKLGIDISEEEYYKMLQTLDEIPSSATPDPMDFDECFISDESSLWDFHGKESNDSYYLKIKEKFDVDVSDIKDAKLGAIFQHIHEYRNSA